MSLRCLSVLLLLVVLAADGLRCFDNYHHKRSGPFDVQDDGCVLCAIGGMQGMPQATLATECVQEDNPPTPVISKKVCFDYSDKTRVCYCNSQLCNSNALFTSASTISTVSSVLLLVSVLVHSIAF
ncbi:hypothetical protein M3Y99_01148300 [Aphelenchoides fujianensis]|nr:hypothetical protein M3Y99_01148300 [Aphelenchoides fujianensis]